MTWWLWIILFAAVFMFALAYLLFGAFLCAMDPEGRGNAKMAVFWLPAMLNKWVYRWASGNPNAE